MIHDEILFENKISSLQMKCFVCSSKVHDSISCPLVQYIPNRSKIVKKYVKDPGQEERLTFNRFRTNRFNSLRSRALVQKTSENYREIASIFFESNPRFSESNFSEEMIKSDLDITSSKKLEEIKENNDLNFIELKKSKSNFPKKVNNVGNLNNFDEFENLAETDRDDLNAKESLPLDHSLFIKTFNGDMIESQVYNKLNSSFNEENTKTNKEPEINFKKNRFLTVSPKLLKNGHSLPTLKNKNIQIIPISSVKNKKFERSIKKQLTKNNDSNIEIAENTNIINELQIKEEEKINLLNRADIFEKQFEKGTDFKNYYPEFNLSKFLEIHKKTQQKKGGIFCFKNMNRKKSMKRRLKNNRITPTILKSKEEITIPNRKDSPIMARRESIRKDPFSRRESIRKDNKQYSNIFVKRQENLINEKQKYTFLEVVNEVLYNQELRKKLFAMRDKAMKKKHLFFN